MTSWPKSATQEVRYPASGLVKQFELFAIDRSFDQVDVGQRAQNDPLCIDHGGLRDNHNDAF